MTIPGASGEVPRDPGFLNPWWWIWVQPRETIRWIVDTDPKLHFWLLAVFYGVLRAMDWGIITGVGDEFTPAGVAGFIAIAGPIGGIAGVYLTASLLGIVGRMMGGKAEGVEIRAVLVWAAMPMSVLTLISLVPYFMMLGPRVFSAQDPLVQRIVHGNGISASFLGGGLASWKALLDMVGSLYYLLIGLTGFAEVQKFGLLKAVGVFFVVMGGMLLIGLCIALIAGTSI
jgi:hypothetical protein